MKKLCVEKVRGSFSNLVNLVNLVKIEDAEDGSLEVAERPKSYVSRHDTSLTHNDNITTFVIYVIVLAGL